MSVAYELNQRWAAFFKRWAMGTHHGLQEKHIDIYCNEFVFR